MGVKLVIDRVHLIPMGMANAFLIETNEGVISGYRRSQTLRPLCIQKGT
jgi:hypothetical protein